MKIVVPLHVCCMLLLGACSSVDVGEDAFSSKMDELTPKGAAPLSYSASPRQIGGSSQRAGLGVSSQGSGRFVAYGAPPVSLSKISAGEGQGYSLNLVGASIKAASQSVLGDTLGLNYVVDPRLTGTVTLQTSTPVTKDALLDIFESALSISGAVVVKSGDVYKVTPASEALSAAPSVGGSSSIAGGPGIKVQVFELKFISAKEMSSILTPISRQGSILRVDDTRNLIVLAGSGPELSSMRETISLFDVDWMRGMSVAIHPLKASRPAAVAKELDTIFATDNGPGSRVIRFVPNDRLRSVLVITSRPAYLQRAASWISKLDNLASANDAQLFVYDIQNRPAKELAQVLQAVINGQASRSSGTHGTDTVAPDLEKASLAADAPKSEGEDVVAEVAGYSAEPAAPGTSIVADVENNALLISTTAREYERIQVLLRQLDIAPTQVLLEAVIAEVTLNDELKFGLRWFFENDKFGIGLSDLASGAVGASFPGFSWSYATSDIRVTLNALSSVANVNVVSAPTLMALNNQKAMLQVGDQVPIVTQQSASVDGNSPVINSIELKDTGVILSVIPRINSSGRIMLDIQQEVSDVVRTTSSGIDSPTIQQRKVSTRVVVSDNESVALGGLIQQKHSSTQNKVPLFGDLPVLGAAFKNKVDVTKKTELIIFIKPRIVRDVNEARSVTDEFRQQLSFGGNRKEKSVGAKLQQDLKRIVN